MTFEQYQAQALTTAYTDSKYDETMARTIWAMGIAGEAGEVLEKWKKIVAYGGGTVTDEHRTDLTKELGDVLWYVAVFAHQLGIPLEDIVATNVQKLQDRKKRDVIKGAGDNR